MRLIRPEDFARAQAIPEWQEKRACNDRGRALSTHPPVQQFSEVRAGLSTNKAVAETDYETAAGIRHGRPAPGACIFSVVPVWKARPL